MQYPPNNQPPFQQQPNTQYPPQQPWQQPGQWQQPQYLTPPGTYYPPQQSPMMPPPPPPRPPRKKQNPWFILGIIVGVLILCGAIGNAVTKSSPSNSTTNVVATDTPITSDTPIPTATLDTAIPTDTPAPTQPPAKWTTTHTFTGNGIKKTAIFSVPDDWKILWSCNAQSFYGSQYNVQVYVYNSDGSLADVAINELCKPGNTSGETEEHQSGDNYLEVNSEAAWKVQIQEFK